MSNRFKFRVWLPDENRYLHNTDCPVVDSDGNLMWCYLNPFGHWKHHKMENAVIEQCTGIRDANDVLIYEGDLVQTITGAIGEVRWLNGGFVAVYPGNLISFSSVCGTMKVIGNIHEMEGK